MIHIMRRRKTALNVETSRAKVSTEVKLLQRASQSDYFLPSVEHQSIGMEVKMLCLVYSFIKRFLINILRCWIENVFKINDYCDEFSQAQGLSKVNEFLECLCYAPFIVGRCRIKWLYFIGEIIMLLIGVQLSF